MDGSEERTVLRSGVCGRESKGLDYGRMVRPTHTPAHTRDGFAFIEVILCACGPFPLPTLTLRVAQCPHFQAPATRVRNPTRHRTLWHFVFYRWPRRGW